MGKFQKFSSADERFLLERLRDEWEKAERSTKIHEITKRAGRGGVFLAKSLLAFGAIAGSLAIAAVSPNAFAAIGKLHDKPQRRFYTKEPLEDGLRQLQRGGLIKKEKIPAGYQIKVTPKGLRSVLRETFSELKIRGGKWDGTWWIVMFDIPRRHNAERNALRTHLRSLGLTSFQDSVFVSKYPCADEVWFLTRLLGISSYVAIAHADSFTGRGELLRELR
jgi:hypothetical protein